MSIGFIFLAIGINAAIAAIAFQRRSVSLSGAIAGLVVGSLILVLDGYRLWAILMVFFISSSIISRVGRAKKSKTERLHQKGSQRDALQVIANAGAGLVCTIAAAATGNPAWSVGAAASLAAATADTWASEIGVLSGRAPRSLVSRKELEPGSSGAVSGLGNAAAFAGAVVISLIFAVWTEDSLGITLRLRAFVIVAAVGYLGCVLDSFVGATVQALYRSQDGTLTERRTAATASNQLVRGWRFVTNDVVNLAATAGAAAAGGGLGLLLL